MGGQSLPGSHHRKSIFVETLCFTAGSQPAHQRAATWSDRQYPAPRPDLLKLVLENGSNRFVYNRTYTVRSRFGFNSASTVAACR